MSGFLRVYVPPVSRGILFLEIFKTSGAPQTRLPLVLAAHKSSAGHAEAAAGLVGIACATLALESASLPQILHLR